MDKICKPIENKNNLSIVLLIATFLHFIIIVLILMGSLFSESALSLDGDKSMKAMMIDFSIMAAPQQSLAQNTINNEELPTPDETEKEIVQKEDKEKEVEPDIIVENKIKQPVVTPNEPTLVIKEKPNKPKKQFHKKVNKHKVSKAQVKQEIMTEKRSDVSTASAISENNQYSEMPTAISRNLPEYPRRALDMRIDGHVIVMFDIDNHGNVDNIRIIEAKPNNIFNRSVIQAMKRWKYPPRMKKDLKTKVIFNRNKSVKFDN